MSKYDKTRFYWLQLKEDFFEDDAINWLEEQKPNGRDYAYFYLKLCLKSLKSNGILIREVGNILIPYDNNKLAELTKMDFDTVCVAMELLKKIGLIEILEDGEIYLTQLENLIGSTSRGAFKKQLQIQRRNEERQLGWNEGGNNSTKVKDKDKVKDINNSSSNKIINMIENEFGSISPTMYEKIYAMADEYDNDLIIEAIKECSLGNHRNLKYLNGILRNWKNDNIKSVKDLKPKPEEEPEIDYEELDAMDQIINDYYGL